MKLSFSTKGWHDSSFDDFCTLAVDLGFDEKGRFADPRLVDEISFSRQFTPPDGKIEVDWKRNPGREDLAGKLRAFFDRIDRSFKRICFREEK